MADELADPERALAVAHAPAPVRSALAALFALDERFGAIVASTSEPMIGLMRLAWWREALEKLDQHPAPAEPLLKLLADLVLPHGVTGTALAAIEDGWAALIDGEPDEAAIARHGQERGVNLFRAAAALLGADDPRLPSAGEIWALVDLGYRHSNAEVRKSALAKARKRVADLPAGHWAPAARPLAALFVLARRDAAAITRAPGRPDRMLRMLALRLTGR
ncbi:MAG: squalene/phytoene synthase family protein [Sphingomonas sp.]|nr:squalene/phytoene synthase family protein [Sphingomonas sp.]